MARAPLQGSSSGPAGLPIAPCPVRPSFLTGSSPVSNGRVSDVLFGTAIYSWHRNTNTAQGGVPQKNPPALSPQCPLLSLTLFLQSPQLLSIHLAGISVSPLLSQLLLCLCPFTLPHPLCYSKSQQFTVGAPPELNLCSSICISDPLGPDLFTSTPLWVVL